MHLILETLGLMHGSFSFQHPVSDSNIIYFQGILIYFRLYYLLEMTK